MVFFFLSAQANSQSSQDYAVHANIIYRFTKYIDWPQDKKKGDFIIGVAGDTPLFEEMKNSIEGKMVGDQKIVIKKFSSSSAFTGCSILFVSEEASGAIKKIASRTAWAPLLIVSESEGLAQTGSCINLSIVADHLKLEINKTNIEQRSLGIASELLQLGKIVK